MPAGPRCRAIIAAIRAIARCCGIRGKDGGPEATLSVEAADSACQRGIAASQASEGCGLAS